MSKSRLQQKAKAAKSEKRILSDDDEDEDEEGQGWKGTLLAWAKDFLIALAIIIVLVVVLFIYTGNWPPLVVVESNSMMHDYNASEVGVIDTGDMVLVKRIDTGDYRTRTVTYNGEPMKIRTGLRDITTWVDHKEKHYSNYGDVIIFEKNGKEDSVPVIHRAVVWLRANDTNGDINTLDGYTYDIPSMGLYAQTGVVTIPDYPAFGKNGDDKIVLSIDIGSLLERAKENLEEPQSGYITKGDWNHNQIDQFHLVDEATNKPIGLVRPNWIIGKAKFELPWFGLIKLFITGKLTDTNPAPKYSWLYLGLTMAIIIATVVAIDFGIAFATKRYKKKKEGEDGDGEEDETEKGEAGAQLKQDKRGRRGGRGGRGDAAGPEFRRKKPEDESRGGRRGGREAAGARPPRGGRTGREERPPRGGRKGR